MKYTPEIEHQLKKLQELIGCEHLDVTPDENTPEHLSIWKLYHGRCYNQVAQLEARFGSHYSDQPDGFAAWLDGHNWTDYLPTVEECAVQLQQRRYL